MKTRNLILRIIIFPFVLIIILIKYNYHAFRNVYLFLLHGGEWITYARDEQATILEIFKELKELKR